MLDRYTLYTNICMFNSELGQLEADTLIHFNWVIYGLGYIKI